MHMREGVLKQNCQEGQIRQLSTVQGCSPSIKVSCFEYGKHRMKESGGDYTPALQAVRVNC